MKDYVDTVTTERKEREMNRFLQTGDYLVSYEYDYKPLEGRWPLPAPDVNGVCSDMNAIRWYINQDLPPCSRPVTPLYCGGGLDPSLYSTSVKVESPGWYSPSSTLQVNITLGEVWVIDSDGMMSQRENVTSVGSTGSNCICQGVLREARYRVISDSNQKYIRSILVDLVTGDTDSCSPVQQKFSVQFLSEFDGFSRSGNPGYLPNLPVLFKSTSESTEVSHIGLRGIMTSGECPVITAINDTISANYTEIRFLTETIMTCYVEMTLAELRTYCGQNINPLSPIFSFDFEWPLYVSSFGNPHIRNSDDFIPFRANRNFMNPIWNEENATCTLANTWLYEFIVTDVGFHSNPQSKIVYAKAGFLNDT